MSAWDGIYPTDDMLERIVNWDCIPNGEARKLMDFVRSVWWADDWGWHQKGDDHYVSTGGWSGNESVITALQHNFLFWSLHHRSTRAGGHYMFCFHTRSHALCDKCKGTGLKPLARSADDVATN